MVSSENEENVVKPPRMPIKIKVLILDDKLAVSQVPQSIPMIKDPKMLTINVPMGKVPVKYLWVIPETAYRPTVPMAPPAINKKIFVIIIILYQK
jgi:hypothetical protein